MLPKYVLKVVDFSIFLGFPTILHISTRNSHPSSRLACFWYWCFVLEYQTTLKITTGEDLDPWSPSHFGKRLDAPFYKAMPIRQQNLSYLHGSGKSTYPRYFATEVPKPNHFRVPSLRNEGVKVNVPLNPHCDGLNPIQSPANHHQCPVFFVQDVRFPPSHFDQLRPVVASTMQPKVTAVSLTCCSRMCFQRSWTLGRTGDWWTNGKITRLWENSL